MEFTINNGKAKHVICMLCLNIIDGESQFDGKSQSTSLRLIDDPHVEVEFTINNGKANHANNV